MKIGPAIRKWMPASFERRAAGVYRRVFVDLGKVATRLAEALPQQAKVLDIGGGDGELLNKLFALRPDITVVMVDVADSVGKFIEPRFLERVQFLPRTFIEDHAAASPASYDAAIIVDVLHHIPVAQRHGFLSAVRQAVRNRGSIFVKDLEPGHFISMLSLYCDWYVSGDRGVVLVSMSGLRALADELFPGHVSNEIGLRAVDAPNYIVRIDVA
jgi:2-polyprenyl-3-methyl-5-hydroxy-6-metoxy-1,4-benzoquinol methylase